MSVDLEKRCPNCGGGMKFVRREDVQLGRAGILSGVWPNIWAGALDVELWGCPSCRKLDFYWSGEDGGDIADWDGGNRMAQAACPACGLIHDLDDPRCPRCGAKNPKI